MRAFLGLFDYHKRFIQGYATIAAPLIDMLQHDHFHWSEEALGAFYRLKHALCSTSILQLPDFSQQFVGETDAS